MHPPRRLPFLPALAPLLAAVACGSPPEVEQPNPPPDISLHEEPLATAGAEGAAPGAGSEDAGHHPFSDLEYWGDVLDDPARDSWQKPELLLKKLRIEPGSTVADVGAGTGYFNPHLATAVGESGRVLALDTEPAMVEHMKKQVQQEGLATVEPRLVEPGSPGLEPDSVDYVLVVNTYHHIPERVDYFGELAAALRADGRLAVVDYVHRETPMGPPLAQRVAPEVVRKELAEAGFDFVVEHEVLPYQYVLVFDTGSEGGTLALDVEPEPASEPASEPAGTSGEAAPGTDSQGEPAAEPATEGTAAD